MRTNALQAKKALLALFAMLVPMLASAQTKVEIDGIWYNLNTNSKQAEVTSKSSGKYSGTITIPATVNYKNMQYSVTSIGDNAFWGCHKLTAIAIPEGVTSLEYEAFCNCSALASVTIPENSKLTNIGDFAFEGCSALKSFTIPKDVTTIKRWAFRYCNIDSITIPENVSFIGRGAFSTYSLSSIEVDPNNKVYDSRNNCNAIIRTNDNTLITGGLTTVIPSDVVSIDTAAFYDRRNLTSIIIPENVTSIEEIAFSGCYSLTAITIPEGVTSIGNSAFRYCYSLTAITIPESVTSIGNLAFESCKKLDTIICQPLTPPTIETKTFAKGRWGSVFYVPRLSLEAYNTAEVWKDLEGYTFKPVTYVHLVKFMIDDEVIMEDSLEYGTDIIPPTIKDKEGYTFVWQNIEKKVPNHDVVYRGKYVPNTYTINYMIDGDIVQTDSVTYGAAITLLEEPTKEGYTFSGWGEAPETMPANDIVISGAFIINRYFVSFKIGEEVIAADSLEYGAAIIAPEAPEKEGHTFAGWGEVDATVPAKDVTYEGSYIANNYTVTFKIGEEVIYSESLPYGAEITVPKAPAKEGHAFAGWGEVAETVPASDVTYEGSYTVNNYTVTFKIGEDVIYSESLPYGAEITAPEAPEKEGHTFAGWGEVAATVPAGDVTYEGSYTANSYLLTYVVDGETVQADSVVYDTAITALAEPTKEGHTFSGWGEIPATMPAKDVTISGAFIINKYLVTFNIGDEVITSDSLEYGAAIVVPEAPEKEGHTFAGWGEVAAIVPAGDVTYEGSYTVNIYHVYYYVGEELVHTAEVAYGEAIPEYTYEPTTEGDIFVGWIGETYDTMPAHDVTYTANIENGIDQFTIDNSQLTIYDLTGRKVTDTENLKGGIYIINGKKTVIK